jgi:hypothetical protein
VTAPRDLEVRVPAAPDPALLRAAITAKLSGRPWPPGPEAAVADAVARAAAAVGSGEVPPWRG